MSIKKTCPKCSSEKLDSIDTCHTWKQGEKWMSCFGCFTATLYYCDGCDWQYTHGLNCNNPKYEKNEQSKPQWLEGHREYDISALEEINNE